MGGEKRMLSEGDLKSITLRSPFVHEHADRPYFIHEINGVSRHLGEPAHLNYFVRYLSDKTDSSKYKWSRVEKVIFLDECSRHAAATGDAASAQKPLTIHTGAEATKTGGTVVWRNKLFWVALVVAGEPRPVYLPRLSKDLPTEEEVMRYCAYQSVTNPEEAFSTVAPRSPTAPADGEAVAPTTSSDSGLDAAAVARTFLPTPDQIAKLRRFREERIVRHQWSTAETEEAARLHAKYARTDAIAATAPIAATTNRVRNMQLETRIAQHSQSQSSAVTAAAPFSQPSSTALGGDTQTSAFGFSQDLATPTQGGMGMGRDGGSSSQPSLSQQQQPTARRNLRGQTISTARSPFLPKRKLLATTPHATPLPSDQSQGPEEHLLGAESQSSFSAFADATPPSQAVPATSSMSPAAASAASLFDRAMIEEVEREYARQEGFYSYISDAQRSGYLNKIASITHRNAQTNRRKRLEALEIEKKAEKTSKFVESGGLWITNDRERAEKAEQYRLAQEGSAAGAAPAAPAPATTTTATAAATTAATTAAAPAAADPPLSKEEQERQQRAAAMLQAFREKHQAQSISFDAVPDEWISGDAAAATAKGAVSPPPQQQQQQPQMGSAAAATPYRLHVRHADDDDGTAAKLVTSQLLHRSAAAMATATATATAAADSSNSEDGSRITKKRRTA